MMSNNASAGQMWEAGVAGRPTPTSLTFNSCRASISASSGWFGFIGMPGHAPLSHSAICYNNPVSNWVSGAVIFVLANGHFTVPRCTG